MSGGFKKNNPKVYLHVVIIDTCTVAGEANKNKSAIELFRKNYFFKNDGVLHKKWYELCKLAPTEGTF